jgi:predicted nuclease with RNAse H fold
VAVNIPNWDTQLVDSVVGIDLSGVTTATKGRTVAAEIRLTDPLTLVDRLLVPRRARGDRILLDWMATKRPRLVGIDAPLTLPHSIGCTDRGCARCEPGSANYLERDVDAMARRMGGGMPFVMLAAIAFRAMYLARKLNEIGIETVEVYPAAAYRAMGVGRASGERADALKKWVGDFEWSIPDELDAVCAAIVTGHSLSSGSKAIRGFDGSIALPSLP